MLPCCCSRFNFTTNITILLHRNPVCRRHKKEYLAPQIRSMNNWFHSEPKLPRSYDYPLANHIATNKSSDNPEMPLVSRLLSFFIIITAKCDEIDFQSDAMLLYGLLLTALSCNFSYWNLNFSVPKTPTALASTAGKVIHVETHP